ncbi:MAG: DMT family transporter, partial [Anaerotignum sp.]|nr:DMT family transporter [Anaerotignum sp.]
RGGKMAYILVVIAGISWGLIGVFTKAIAALGFAEMQMLFVKGVIASTVLFLITFFKDKSQLKLKHWKDIRYFFGTGIVSFAFFSWAYMKAVNLTNLGVAAVLLYTAPTFVMLFSILLFGEKMTKTKGIVLLMTFVGCIFVTGLLEGGMNFTWQGIAIGLAAGVGYALYSIFGTYAIKAGYGSLTISLYTFLMATIVMTCLVEPVEVVSRITEMGQWPLAVSFALLTTVLPYLTYTKGLSGLPASKASVTATIEPVVAALLGIFVFHESVSMLKLTGIVLVLSSVVVMSRQSEKE